MYARKLFVSLLVSLWAPVRVEYLSLSPPNPHAVVKERVGELIGHLFLIGGNAELNSTPPKFNDGVIRVN